MGDNGNVAGDARPRHVRGVCPGPFWGVPRERVPGGARGSDHVEVDALMSSLPALNAGLVSTRRVSLPTGRSATVKVTTLARTSSC